MAIYIKVMFKVDGVRIKGTMTKWPGKKKLTKHSTNTHNNKDKRYFEETVLVYHFSIYKIFFTRNVELSPGYSHDFY